MIVSQVQEEIEKYLAKKYIHESNNRKSYGLSAFFDNFLKQF